MSYRGLCAVLIVGVLAAACSTTERRTVVVPAPTPVDDSCTYYGYTPGTEGYRVCVDREAAARARGRMNATYARDRIVADSQEACGSYGLVRGTDRYDRCVQREVNYRNPA
jgi:hypothetical protein